jgi:hypothetical protein
MKITKRHLRRIIKEELSLLVEQIDQKTGRELYYPPGEPGSGVGDRRLTYIRDQFKSLGFDVEDRATRETSGSPIIYVFGPPAGWEWYFMGPDQGVPNYQVTIGKSSEPCEGYDSKSPNWGKVRKECFEPRARAFVDKIAEIMSRLEFKAKSFDRDTRVDEAPHYAIFYGASIEGSSKPNSSNILMTIFAAGGNMATNARISFELVGEPSALRPED